MDQRVFTIVFIGITIIAVAILGFAKFQENTSVTQASPSPNPETILNPDNPSNPTSQVAPMNSPSPSLKPIKQYQGFLLLKPEELKNKKAVIETTKGRIEFDIYPEATKSASNFIFLAKDKFYDGLTFHRVVPKFVIQGGDPKGDGTGGPGYKFEDEPVTKKYDKGIVAMANSGPNTNGSQFFIMLEDNPQLPPNYTIFGKVSRGQDVVGKIQVGDVMTKVTVAP